MSAEGFQPRAHWAPTTPWRRLLFRIRLIADLQTNTIYRDLRPLLAGFSGRLLDVGCGNSPFRHLLDPARTEYQGIDVKEAASFGYGNPDTVYYDGHVIPFPDASFDALLCTEVLEHVAEPAELVAELHRVLKPGGFGVVTLPWSARFHYQPHDYHRYTPSMLDRIFRPFAGRAISPRGTDLSSIASKVVVAYLRNLVRVRPVRAADWALAPIRVVVAAAALPVLAGALLLGHGGIWFGLGSTDDPLGYTVVIRK
jgi:SAM-dependent methyltransferase